MTETNVKTVTDWQGNFQGITLVFQGGESLHVDWIPKQSTWCTAGGQARFSSSKQGVSVLPNDSEHAGVSRFINVTAEVLPREGSAQGDVQYRLSSPEGDQFAVLPTLIFQILEGRTRCADGNRGEKLLPTGNRTELLFVAATLMERWLQTEASDSLSGCYRQCVDAYLSDPLNAIAAQLEWLQSAEGMLAAALQTPRGGRPGCRTFG